MTDGQQPIRIRVLVAEDSPTVQEMLVRILESDDRIQVVGRAGDGFEAVSLAEKLKPDLITMDALMPNMDGLEATRCIMSRCPTQILMVTSLKDSSEHNVAFEALSAGALDVIGKTTESQEWRIGLLSKVKALALLKKSDD